MNKVTRTDVINAFKALPDNTETTTFRIAKRLACKEKQVRAAISWCVAGGQLIDAGITTREDTRGRKYTAKLYNFSGDDEIFRVPQDPTDRKMARERRNSSVITEYLSRPW